MTMTHLADVLYVWQRKSETDKDLYYIRTYSNWYN